ncbi:MAG: NAD(P)H-hydrate epimerase [Candidatus Nanohaloarchaea archaeon]
MVEIDYVSREQMERIDEKVPEEYGITISRMMENAGFQIAEFVRREIDPESIAVYAGKGNNGGDALAAARRLYLWGYDVEVVLATRELDGIRKQELLILENLDVKISDQSAEKECEVVLEGLIGYNLEGDPRPPFDSMIEEINSHNTVISIDIPAGLDPDTGEKTVPAVEPDYTVTLAAPFDGLDENNSGEVWIADISIPPEAYQDFVFSMDIFGKSSLVRMVNP